MDIDPGKEIIFMTVAGIIGGVVITIIVLAACIVLCVGGLVFVLRYLVPIAIAICLAKLLVDFVQNKVLA